MAPKELKTKNDEKNELKTKNKTELKMFDDCFFKGLGDLRADNQRLKDENAALIRVISKLSRWKKNNNNKEM